MGGIDKRSFVLRRIHSITGLLPVGLFLIEHLFTNAYAMRGSELFNERVEFLLTLPFVWAIEAVFIFLPLFYHLLYGLIITVTAQPNTVAYPYGRNWHYLMQRISGMILLLFIVYHLLGTKIWALQQGALQGVHPDFFARMAELLAQPWALVFYITGVLAAVYHFANGMWNFGITWGITVSRTSQQRASVIWGLVGVALFVLGISSLLSFNGHWPGSLGH